MKTADRPSLEKAIELAKDAKENEADYPLPNIIEFTVLREDLVFTIFPPLNKPPGWPENRPYDASKALFDLADLAVPMLRAEHGLFISDSYAQYVERSLGEVEDAITSGRTYGPHKSMSDAWEAGDGEKYGIGEVMVIQIYSRLADTGNVEVLQATYQYKNQGDHIEWSDSGAVEWVGTEDEEGYVNRRVRAAFKQPSPIPVASEVLAQVHSLGLHEAVDNDDLPFMCDLIALRQIAETGARVLVAHDDPVVVHKYERKINDFPDPTSAIRVGPNRAERRAAQRDQHRKKLR